MLIYSNYMSEKKNCDADVSSLLFLPANFLRISTEKS